MSAPILGRVDVGRIGTALLAALAVCILPVGTAHAQLFGPQYRSSWDSQVSFGHKHGHGNYHSVQAPTRERQLPFRSGTHKGTATVSFRHKHQPGHGHLVSLGHKHQPGHGNLVSFRHKYQHKRAKSELAKKPEPRHALKTELAKKLEPQDAVKTELAKKAEPQGPPKGPFQIIISIAEQRISLYDNGALIARSSVSTGVQGYPTPLGIFSVISKERWHRSNIYSGAPMPYMQRFGCDCRG